ncbi:MAG TPA: dTDP-4-dehydrorhamnose 3,5-epimerase [Planctomycetota bacterium]
MIFHELELPGVFRVELERFADERGFFARTWSPEVMAAQGLDAGIAQMSSSWNAARGTLRGMHWQEEPHAEAKLVRCTRGAIYDVVLDLRADSAAFGRWTAVELGADNHLQLYIPKGCAHGFQTLQAETEVSYLITAPYAPHAARGVRWDDPAFGIEWPLPVAAASARDRTFPAWTGPLP